MFNSSLHNSYATGSQREGNFYHSNSFDHNPEQSGKVGNRNMFHSMDTLKYRNNSSNFNQSLMVYPDHVEE